MLVSGAGVVLLRKQGAKVDGNTATAYGMFCSLHRQGCGTSSSTVQSVRFLPPHTVRLSSRYLLIREPTSLVGCSYK